MLFEEKDERLSSEMGDMFIEDLDLSVRAYNALYRLGIRGFTELLAAETWEKVRRCTPKSVYEELRGILAEHGVAADIQWRQSQPVTIWQPTGHAHPEQPVK